MTTATPIRYVRTGHLAPLLPSLSALDRGSTTVHVAEDTVAHYENLGGEGPFDHRYPERIALCGAQGWGEAGSGVRNADQTADLSRVNCPRCLRTTRFQAATR
jgi:hypothetical protein